MSPTTNSFFSTTTGYDSEVNLLDDLCIEQIAMFGVDILYLPRTLVNLDAFMNDATKSRFEMGLSMPVYIKSFSGYNSGMEILTKFGLNNTEEITLVMSKSQFTTYYGPFIKSQLQAQNDASDSSPLDVLKGQTANRPREGDLIFFPFDGGLFEIKYVLFDLPFFQFGKNYTFELQCEKFEFDGSEFDTSIDAVDEIQDNTAYYRLQFTLNPNGKGTFLHHENVKVYDFNLMNHVPFTDDEEILNFLLYNVDSLLEETPYVTAKIMRWNQPLNELVIGNVSNQDPTQINSVTGNLDNNKLDNVIIVGQQSGAVFYSNNANTENTPFDDEIALQTEFDRMKILDEGDEFEFGFF